MPAPLPPPPLLSPTWHPSSPLRLPRYDVLELNASDTRSRAQIKASLLPVIGSQVLCFGRGASLPRAGAGSGAGGGSGVGGGSSGSGA